MSNRRIWLFVTLIILTITIVLLVTGSPILNMALDENESVPLGTFITWIGIISLPCSIYWGLNDLRNPTERFYKYLAIVLRIILVLALLWMPICYLLAGNISFSFSEKDTFQGGQLAMKWFWRFSYAMAIGPILLLIIYVVSLLLVKKRNKT